MKYNVKRGDKMKLKKMTVYIILCMLLAMILFNAQKSMYAAESALHLCAKTVIPSLFPFFVISALMINTGLLCALAQLISPLSKILFKTNGSGAVAFICGVLCGYPTGAKTIADMYKNKMLSKKDAERLLPFCNNSGPLFVIGAAGQMLNSTHLGICLYVVHVLSALCCGVLLSIFKSAPKDNDTISIKTQNLGKAFSDAVSGSAVAMLNVCAYIVFFTVMQAFLSPVICGLFQNTVFSRFLLSLGEVTVGVKNIITSSANINEACILISGALGFGGICVFLQVAGIANGAGLSVKKYLFGKTLQMSLSVIISYFVFGANKTAPAFLSFSQIAKRYINVMPIALLSLLIALIYFAARRN